MQRKFTESFDSVGGVMEITGIGREHGRKRSGWFVILITSVNLQTLLLTMYQFSESER